MADITITVDGNDYTFDASLCPCCGCCGCGCAFCLKIQLRLINGCGGSGPYVIEDTHGAPVIRWLKCSGTREWSGINPLTGMVDTHFKKVSGVWDLTTPWGHWTSTSTDDCPPALTSMTFDSSGAGSGDPCDPGDNGTDGLNIPQILSGEKDRHNDSCCKGPPDFTQVATDHPTVHILCSFTEPGGCLPGGGGPGEGTPAGFDADFDPDIDGGGYTGGDFAVGSVTLLWDYDACRWKIVAVNNPSGSFGRTRIAWGPSNPTNPVGDYGDEYTILGIAQVNCGECEGYEVFCPDETFSAVVSDA